MLKTARRFRLGETLVPFFEKYGVAMSFLAVFYRNIIPLETASDTQVRIGVTLIFSK